MHASLRLILTAAAAAFVVAASAGPAAAQWQIETKDGKSSL